MLFPDEHKHITASIMWGTTAVYLISCSTDSTCFLLSLNCFRGGSSLLQSEWKTERRMGGEDRRKRLKGWYLGRKLWHQNCREPSGTITECCVLSLRTIKMHYGKSWTVIKMHHGRGIKHHGGTFWSMWRPRSLKSLEDLYSTNIWTPKRFIQTIGSQRPFQTFI